MPNINETLIAEAHDKRRTLMERSRPGRTGAALPASDVPPQLMPEQSLLRENLFAPEVSEGEIVRYFTHLSQLNFSVDTNFYPLGSCTMKYNPRVNEAVAALPGFAMAHPQQAEHQMQGTLEALYTLQDILRDPETLEVLDLPVQRQAQ